MWGILRDAVRHLRSGASRGLDAVGFRSRPETRGAPPLSRDGSRPSRGTTAAPAGWTYPGDHHGPFAITYHPHEGRLADPGEVVWTWVPYEEDPSVGKDRPVMIVGREGSWLLGLPLTSKDHHRDEAQEASQGRFWVDIGRGPWDDRSRKTSAVRVDRVVRVDPDRVRRVGGRVPKVRFELVASALREHWND